VLAVAAILSCLLKKPSDEDNDSDEVKAKTLDQDDEWIYEIPPEDSEDGLFIVIWIFNIHENGGIVNSWCVCL